MTLSKVPSPLVRIRNISRIRKFLSVSSTKALVHAFVTCRLDNCNSLLYGLPKHLVHRLQFAQNCAARLILCGRKHDRVTPLLRELHWLPVEQRIIFKMLFFTFKALNNLCPSYISDLLETYKPTRSLRSSSRNLLVIPRSKLKSYGDRAFSVSAPKLWHDIPETITCSVDLNAFKRNLKTYLFKGYFMNDYVWLLFLFFTSTTIRQSFKISSRSSLRKWRVSSSTPLFSAHAWITMAAKTKQ